MEGFMPNSSEGNVSGTPTAGLNPDTLRADAKAAAGEIQALAENVVDEASAQANVVADQAKAQIAQATDKAREVATDQKKLLAAQVGDVADAMERVAEELEGNAGAGARYARLIADNAEKLSSTLRDKSVDELIGIAQEFGRKQPAAFIGAAALLGFVASRFLVASAKRPAAEAGDEPITEPAAAATSDSGRSFEVGRIS
jgi:hypothetical protein